MRAWLAVFVLCSCGKELNPDYCQVNPKDPDCINAGLVFIDAAPPCSADPQCAVQGKNVCDTTLGVCVECTTSDHLACTGATPQCNGNDVCVGCVSNGDCASGICIEATATCADQSKVLYAAPMAPAANTCKSAASPCTLKNALAVARADTPGDVIQLAPGMYMEGPLALDIPMLTIVAAGAANVTGMADGPIFTITNGPVEIDDLEISVVKNADAITCTGAQVTLAHVSVHTNPKNGFSTSGCKVVIDRSTFTANKGSSLYFTDADITIRNNFIYGNGDPNMMQGGVSFNGSTHGQFRFNTVAFNVAKSGMGSHPSFVGGMDCNQDPNSGVTAHDNLFADNSPIQTAENGINCGGNLAITNWIGAASTVKFAMPMGPNYNVHLTAATPRFGIGTTIRDNPNTNCADITHDIDNDTRPQNNACDYGADEFK